NKEMTHMCNLSEGVFAHGVEQGVEKTSYQCIRNLMKNSKLSIDEAMNTLEISKDDQPKYKKWIEEGKNRSGF
ncbi:hypothetical protein, partial [uncultured Dubosiella sp.]|uniref:hypothetical protein n=2 Tax=uncultured Dubosiella sp. TaxID=1937011 RepID=UPI002731A239